MSASNRLLQRIHLGKIYKINKKKMGGILFLPRYPFRRVSDIIQSHVSNETITCENVPSSLARFLTLKGELGVADFVVNFVSGAHFWRPVADTCGCVFWSFVLPRYSH